MITQRMMVGGSVGNYAEWKFTVNTEATSLGEKKAGIPLNLYSQDEVTVDIDWGDGNFSTLSSSDYTDSDSTASVHEYANAGVYQITVGSSQWKDLYLLTIWNTGAFSTPTDGTIPIDYWRKTLTSVDTPFPKLAGVIYFASPTSTTLSKSSQGVLLRQNNNLKCFFHKCSKLATICLGLFDNNPELTTLTSAFNGCSSLQALPFGIFDMLLNVTSLSRLMADCSSLVSINENLFENNIVVSNFSDCFSGCANLGDFVLHIGSPLAEYVSSFVTKKTGALRTIYVPSGSTTETKFNSVASGLGLTIIGE